MPARGGARQGAGRKKGSTNQRIKRLRSEMRAVALRIKQVIPEAFDGDGHALMVAIYKDPDMPIDLRLEAAKAAVRYEKPALSSVEHSGVVGQVYVARMPAKVDDLSEWQKRYAPDPTPTVQ